MKVHRALLCYAPLCDFAYANLLVNTAHKHLRYSCHLPESLAWPCHSLTKLRVLLSSFHCFAKPRVAIAAFCFDDTTVASGSQAEQPYSWQLPVSSSCKLQRSGTNVLSDIEVPFAGAKLRTSCNGVSCCLVCGRDFAPSIAVAAATHRRTHAYASTNEPTLNGTDASTSNWASDRPRLWPQRSMSNTTYGNTSHCVYTAPHLTHRLYLSAKQQYAVARIPAHTSMQLQYTCPDTPACSCPHTPAACSCHAPAAACTCLLTPAACGYPHTPAACSCLLTPAACTCPLTPAITAYRRCRMRELPEEFLQRAVQEQA